MHYLTYVVGDEPAETLLEWGVNGSEYELGGRWGHLNRRAREALPAPAYILYGDGRYISQSEVGKEAMKEELKALGEDNRITIIDLND